MWIPCEFLHFCDPSIVFWQVHAAETSVWTSPPTSPRKTAARTTRARVRRRRCCCCFLKPLETTGWIWLVVSIQKTYLKHVVSTWWSDMFGIVWCCFNVTWHEAFFLLVDGPTWLWFFSDSWSGGVGRWLLCSLANLWRRLKLGGLFNGGPKEMQCKKANPDQPCIFDQNCPDLGRELRSWKNSQLIKILGIECSAVFQLSKCLILRKCHHLVDLVWTISKMLRPFPRLQCLGILVACHGE